MNDWEYYHTSLTALPNIEVLADLPVKIEDCQHNGHIFYLLIKEEAMKKALLQHLGNQEIKATFHYIPLHLSAYGKEHSSFVGSDVNTLAVGKELIRLPLYYEITHAQIDEVVETINNFIKTNY